MIGSREFKEKALRRRLQEIENRVAADLRGHTRLNSRQWRQVENISLRLTLDAVTLDLEDLPDPDGVSDLALSLLARTLSNSSREAEYSTAYLSTLSALTFAAVGNFPTAGVIARAAGTRSESSPFETWAVAVLGDRHMRLVCDEMPQVLKRYCRAEQSALDNGSDEHFEKADEAFDACTASCIKIFPHSDGLLLLLWAQVRQRFKDLSAARILSRGWGFEQSYIQTLLRTSSPLLYPTQAMAIEEHRLLDPSENALVLLPTSTGKSLLGELAIVAAMSDERPLGVYLAPYRALTDQIYRRMRPRLASIHVETEVRRGGYLAERPITGDSREVLVSTPESFDAFLRMRPELRDRIACCVFDEFHLIEQPVRGLRYEAIVGRLRDFSAGHNDTKIVALSPVVSPSPMIMEWLGATEDTTIESAWRPTARRLAIAGPDAQIHYYTPGDYLSPPDNLASPIWSGQVPFPYRISTAPTTAYAHLLRQHDLEVATNVAAVAIDQYKRFELPVMILAATRNQTRFIASIVAAQFAEVEEEHPAHALSGVIARRCPYLFTLRNCLKHGVAYHNASLPNWIRERLEDLMEQQKLLVVVATTTLAEGVDLPFRVVVMADWQQWLFGQQRPMPTLLFRNIAGRCGRAGAFAEGDTVIVDNPGRQPSSANYQDRYLEYLRLYVRPQAINLRSAVAEAVDAKAESYLQEIDAALESQFLAYIDARSPDEFNEENEFTSSLFASRFPDAQTHVTRTVTQFSADMLSVANYPVLARNSPLELTDFGKTVLITGLSPRSGIAIAEFLSNYDPPEEPRAGRTVRRRHSIQWNPIIAALRDAIPEDNVFVAELQSGSFHSIGRRGFPVNDASFITILLAWLSGLPMEEIAFLMIRSRDLKSAAQEWLRTVHGSPPEGFEEQVEQAAVFLNGYVAQQWGWVLRGAGAIAEHAGELERAELDQLASRIEHGVQNTVSVAMLGRGCTVDRAKVDSVVCQFIQEQDIHEFDRTSLLDWIRTERTGLINQQVGYFPGILLDAEDLDLLEEFLDGIST
jgi:helicase